MNWDALFSRAGKAIYQAVITCETSLALEAVAEVQIDRRRCRIYKKTLNERNDYHE